MKNPLSALSTAAVAPTSNAHSLTPGFSRQNGAEIVRSILVLRICSQGRESGEVKNDGEDRVAV